MFSDMLIVNITKPSKLNTATCNITVSEGVYTISAFDIIDGKRSDHQAFELRDRFTVSVVPTKRFTSSSSTTGCNQIFLLEYLILCVINYTFLFRINHRDVPIDPSF